MADVLIEASDVPADLAEYFELVSDGKPDVWHIATQPFSGAHFATFPEALIEPCILAGTSEKGCCPKCYKGWVRTTAKVGEYTTQWGSNVNDAKRQSYPGQLAKTNQHVKPKMMVGIHETTGWQPSCDCQAGDPIPCTVLDPFNGSGTTGAVAIRHQRNYVGIELNADYIALARRRIGAIAPLFASEVA